MPFSDNVPAFVVPDDFEWRQKSIPDMAAIAQEREYGFEGEVRFCPDFRKTTAIDDRTAAIYNLSWSQCYPCANANPMGVRNHNWCYRCPAGFMLIQLHIYDAERERDRAVRL